MRRIPRVIALSVALVAITPTLATVTDAVETASAETEAVDATVTTTLHPGWNMVGWLGPDEPVDVLYEAIPALRQVSAWDAAEQRYASSSRTSARTSGLVQISTGHGLWLKLSGEESFEWIRPALTRSVLLSLHAGRNLVGWAGRDQTGVGAALARFDGSLLLASRWSGAEQSWEHYRPGAPAAANVLAELHHGDALWVDLSSDARWWQSGRIPEPVVFLGEVGEDLQHTIRGWAEGAIAFYAERWGAEAPFSSFVGDIDSLRPVYTEARGAPPRDLCGDEGGGVMLAVVDCVGPATYPHEYFHALQSALREYREVFIPQWLIEGTAVWAATLQVGLTSSDRSLAEHLEQQRADAISAIVRGNAPLADLATYSDFYASGRYGYLKGFFATDWLVERSAEEAVVDFFRLLAGERSWQESFESAFGMPAPDFHEAFERDVALVTSPYSRIRGHILDPDGNPAENAWVLADGGGDGWEDAVTTTSEGAFTLAVRDGRYQMSVIISETGCLTPADEWLTIGAIEVRGADAGIDFTLPAGSSCPAPPAGTEGADDSS